MAGACDSCGPSGSDCAPMGYHIDTKRNYGNGSKYFLLTAQEPPFCGMYLHISKILTN